MAVAGLFQVAHQFPASLADGADNPALHFRLFGGDLTGRDSQGCLPGRDREDIEPSYQHIAVGVKNANRIVDVSLQFVPVRGSVGARANSEVRADRNQKIGQPEIDVDG